MTNTEYIDIVKATYDELSCKIKEDLNEQFAQGRIKGTEYANVYSRLMSEILNLSFESPIKVAQKALIESQKAVEDENRNLIISKIELTNSQKALTDKELLELDAKIALTNAQKDLVDQQSQTEAEKRLTEQSRRNLIGKQASLTDRQRIGFDDNMKLKMLQSQLDAWSLMYSSGILTDKPTIITNDEVSTLYNNMKTELNI